MANTITPQINLFGFSRLSVLSENVLVKAEFICADAFTGGQETTYREITLEDSALGLKWDEDDILYAISDMYPMVQVQWVQAPVVSPVESPTDSETPAA